MALQIWLPLNGNLDNQGVNGITVTNNNATVNDNGKIGKCYYFDKSTPGYLKFPLPFTEFEEGISIAFWIKLPSTVSGNNLVVHIGLGSGWTNNRCTCFVRGGTSAIVFCCGTGSSNSTSTQYNCLSSALIVNEWTHVACVYSTGKMRIYINGVLNVEYTTSIVPSLSGVSEIGVGAAPNANEPGKFYLNDLRIYNNVLSKKEVEELSKGLILHYKLDDPYIEPTTVLSCSPDNSTAYNSSNGKYGYNSTSNLAKTTGVFQGRQCLKIYTLTTGQSALPYTYFSNLFTSDGTNAPAYKTLSFDYYTTVPTTTWLNIYKLGNGTGTATWRTVNTDGIFTGTYTNSSNSIKVKPNEWNHIEVVFHGNDAANAEWGYCMNGPVHTTNENYYFLYANVLLEEKDHATANGASFHSSIAYDCSGFGYNGTPSASGLSINYDTERYSRSLSFDGVNGAITLPTIFKTLVQSVFTMNIWFKKTELGSKNYETLVGGPSGFEMDTRSGSSSTLSLYMASTRGGTAYSPFSLNTWYMVTMVNNGINELYYINGVLVKTIEKKSMPSGTYFIGAWSSATGLNYKGYMSDFRLYSTVLTADQILELYNTSAAIDKLGNVYTRELVE